MLVAAVAVLPLLALHLTHPHGTLAVVETLGHWTVWLTFMVEVARLCVVRDRRAWVDGHRFELLVVALSSPLVPLALALAPALRLLIVAKLFKTLKLAKAIKLAKLGKSVKLLRRKLALRGAASVALGGLALVLASTTVAYMLTGDSALEGARAHSHAHRRRDARDVRRQPPVAAARGRRGLDALAPQPPGTRSRRVALRAPLELRIWKASDSPANWRAAVKRIGDREAAARDAHALDRPQRLLQHNGLRVGAPQPVGQREVQAQRARVRGRAARHVDRPGERPPAVLAQRSLQRVEAGSRPVALSTPRRLQRR